jgi:hypothetical protein
MRDEILHFKYASFNRGYIVGGEPKNSYLTLSPFYSKDEQLLLETLLLSKMMCV